MAEAIPACSYRIQVPRRVTDAEIRCDCGRWTPLARYCCQCGKRIKNVTPNRRTN